MKTLFKLSLLLLMSLAIMGCDDTLNTHPFTFDADGKCYYEGRTSISQETFETQVQGYGWATEATHEIHADGSVEAEDYYTDRYGSNPIDYYFGDTQIKAYFNPNSAPGVSAYALGSYELHDPMDYFPLPIDWEMMIFEVNGTEMHAIIGPGNGSLLPGYDKKEEYLYLRLRRMTEEELAGMNEAHDYHWEDGHWVNEKESGLE